MKSKKAQGISINTVIIVLLALAVLMVTLFVLFDVTGSFGLSTSCTQHGGQCVDNCDPDDTIDEAEDEWCGRNQVCCRIGSSS